MYKNILVIQTAFLGDTLLSIPLLRSLRATYPSAHLSFMCRAGFGDLLRAGGLVDQAIEIKKGDRSTYKQALFEARKLNLDLVVSPHRSFRTALFVRQLGGVETRIGFSDWWSRFAFSKYVRRDLSLHDVDRQLSLLAPLGSAVQRLTEMKLDITGSPQNSIFKDAVILAPGSQWATKRWTESGFVSVGRHCQKQGQAVVLIGTADEAELCARITAEIPGAVSLAGGTDLLELARGLKSAKVLLCNDSGAMHLGVSVGLRVVSVFGATVPSQGYAPWSKTSRVVEVDLKCRPCGRHGHDKCPLGTHDCMKLVTPDIVLRAMSESVAK